MRRPCPRTALAASSHRAYHLGMAEISMKYGSGAITFRVPDANVGAVLRASPAPAFVDALGASLSRQLEAATEDYAGRDVLVLVPDGTRGPPGRAGYAALAPLLREARSVRVLLATGTHKPDTPDNWRIAAEIKEQSDRLAVPLASIDAHDCSASEWHGAGRTAAGNRVLLNTLVDGADAILIASDMKPHYFAGYSSAIKFLLPGVAAFASIGFNHAFALHPLAAACRHPLHAQTERRKNPVAEDQLDAARLITAGKPVYALATVAASDGVAWATFGLLEKAVADGIHAVDERLVHTLPMRYRCAVIGCGGYPNDETLYIAHRSLELTREVFDEQAEVLWLAECRNGIASSKQAVQSFFAPLRENPLGYVEQVRQRYVMFAHKTVKFVELLQRVAALHVVSRLPEGTFPIGTMAACRDPQSVVNRWAERGERILFVDDANKLALTFRTGTA